MSAKKKTKAQVLREELHLLVDDLPPKELYGAKTYLVYLRNLNDPFTKKLLEAPWAEEPLSNDDINALDEAWEAVARGDTVTDEEMRRQIGL